MIEYDFGCVALQYEGRAATDGRAHTHEENESFSA